LILILNLNASPSTVCSIDQRLGLPKINILGYFEQRIIRRAFEYDPDLSPIDIDNFEFPECQDDLVKLTHNETYVTQVDKKI